MHLSTHKESFHWPNHQPSALAEACCRIERLRSLASTGVMSRTSHLKVTLVMASSRSSVGRTAWLPVLGGRGRCLSALLLSMVSLNSEEDVKNVTEGDPSPDLVGYCSPCGPPAPLTNPNQTPLQLSSAGLSLMTILSAPGLYVGWEQCAIPFTITRYKDALYIEWGCLVIGIEYPRR